MIKLVVFDWNGTLFADAQAAVHGANARLTFLGLEPITLKQYREAFEIPASKIINGVKCFRAHIHHFGALSFIYKIPFKGTLDALQNKISTVHGAYQNQSTEDALLLFQKLQRFIVQPKFFQHKSSYVVIHIDGQTQV